MLAQKTIKKFCSLSGFSLHRGKPSEIEFLPARPNIGIVFEVHGQPIPVKPKALVETKDNFTALSNGRQMIIFVEHVLSAVAGAGITNLVIRLTEGDSPPWLDGSAWPYLRSFLKAGLLTQPYPVKENFITKPVFIQPPGSDSFVKVFPAKNLAVQCQIDFPNLIGRQKYLLQFTPANYLMEIARARSFLPYPYTGNEAKTRARLQGLDVNEGPEHLIMYNDYSFISELRYPDEPVRHKILDFIGDLRNFGKIINGYFVLYKPSHKLNRMLVKYLYESSGLVSPDYPATDFAKLSSGFAGIEPAVAREMAGFNRRSISFPS